MIYRNYDLLNSHHRLYLFTSCCLDSIEIHQQRYLETHRILNRFNNPAPPIIFHSRRIQIY